MYSPGRSDRPVCPSCQSESVAIISYGLPAAGCESLWREVSAGRTVLGGCCVTEASPVWHCRECGHRWGRRDGKRGPVFDLPEVTREAERRLREDPSLHEKTRGMTRWEVLQFLTGRRPD
jgi:ribosomal protein L37AE/L43A